MWSWVPEAEVGRGNSQLLAFEGLPPGCWATWYFPGHNIGHLKRGLRGVRISVWLRFPYSGGHGLRKLPTVHSPIIQVKHKTPTLGSHMWSPRTPRPGAKPRALAWAAQDCSAAGISPFLRPLVPPHLSPLRTLQPVPLKCNTPCAYLRAHCAVETARNFPGL